MLRVENGGPGDRGAKVPDEVFRRSSQMVMPPFDPKTEDMDEYINQFKRFAGTQQVPHRYGVTNLLTLLPSTARGVCNSMANDHRDVFEMEVIVPAWPAYSSPIVRVRKRNQSRKYAIIQSNIYYRRV